MLEISPTPSERLEIGPTDSFGEVSPKGSLSDSFVRRTPLEEEEEEKKLN
jgi:hypothetical protein